MGNWKARYPECYRREALESWKAKGFWNGCGRELDAWLRNDWRAGEHENIEWSRGENGARTIFGWKRGDTGRELLRWRIRGRGMLTLSGAEMVGC